MRGPETKWELWTVRGNLRTQWAPKGKRGHLKVRGDTRRWQRYINRKDGNSVEHKYYYLA